MRRLLVLLLALGAVLAFPSQAAAHDVLEKMTPAEGTTVERLPEVVTMTFSDQPLAVGLQVVVRGPGGDVASGAPTIEGKTVTQRLAPTAPGGDYTVLFRVTSTDGHPVSGSFSFHATVGLDGSTATAGPTVAAPSPASPEVASARESQFVPVLLSVVGTVILVGIAGFIIARARR
jgi:methionine-rich copper-binding protein CopC